MILQRFGLLGSPLKPPMTEIRKPADLKADAAIAASLEGVSHRYGKTVALDNVTLTIPGGCMVGLIGPDGVGKSTLLGLISGVRKIQSGAVWTLGGDLRDPKHRQSCYPRVAYMPQGLGRNLYPTLSVFENLDFIARLFGQQAAERKARIDDLLHSTGLDPFPDRPTGKLSGGMKQKVSLCSALIHDPDLVILDEPTTGVDPLSRRQFWELIDRIRERRPQMSVLVATAYMEEAEQFHWLAAMDDGRVIAAGTPAEVRAHAGAETLEAAFIAMLPEERRKAHKALQIPPRVSQPGPPSIEAEGLTKRFGSFTAVDHVSFRIEKGEIFGFLGSNGCGKSTTMKMLTGLLPATEGKATLLGQPVDGQSIEIRRRIGYMSQAFSLYSELTVRQNLELHAKLFDLPASEQGPRVEEMLARFGLKDVANSAPESLPLGVRQRLQLAVAVQHRPEVLILDEPTSGVDPVARDQFWEFLIDLSRKDGVTIFLSTHFMNEADRCDRISLMNAGKVLAADTPTALRESRKAKTLEEAFIGYLEDAARAPDQSQDKRETATESEPKVKEFAVAEVKTKKFSVPRIWAIARREAVEIMRDPVRIAFALLSPMLLMFAFGYGISFDVEHLRFAVFDQNRSLESREFLESFEGSRFWSRQPDISAPDQIQARLRSGELKFAIEIPPLFGSDLLRERRAEIAIWINGDMPNRAETTRTYLGGLTLDYLAKQSIRHARDTAALPSTATGNDQSALPVNIESRFRYNQSLKSVYSMVPSVIMMMLILIPAIMTALGVVREVETGSIANFRSTPLTSLEFLLGKQVPYLVIGLISFATLIVLALFVFAVPVKGSWLALVVGAVIYLGAATAFGLVVSTLTRTQVAAVFATAILALIPVSQFSGLLVPVSSLSGAGRALGLAFPASWFQQISMGTFNKALGFSELWFNHLVLAAFVLAFITAASLILRKQES
jgi:ribosome-dependent ATPase